MVDTSTSYPSELDSHRLVENYVQLLEKLDERFLKCWAKLQRFYLVMYAILLNHKNQLNLCKFCIVYYNYVASSISKAILYKNCNLKWKYFLAPDTSSDDGGGGSAGAIAGGVIGGLFAAALIIIVVIIIVIFLR